MTPIAVVNQSTLVSEFDFHAMVTACQAQVFEDFAPAYEVEPVTVTAYDKIADIPAGAVCFRIRDDGSQPDALGWHTELSDGTKIAEIDAKPCIDAGSQSLTGDYAVSSVLSHEVLEYLFDKCCNVWVDGPDGSARAQEVCDPVEAFSYAISVKMDGREVDVNVSDFVMPNWFDPNVKPDEETDHLGKIQGPFTVGPGGYVVVRAIPNDEQQVFGRRIVTGDVPPPAWRLEYKKRPGSRTGRRLAS